MNAARPILESFDETAWIPIAAAASAMGMNVDHLGRLCCEKLEGERLAIFARGEGRQVGWHVHRSYHPALRGQLDASRDQLPELSDCSPRQAANVRAKWQCVCRFRDARQHGRGLMRDLVEKIVAQARIDFPFLRISSKRLYVWDTLAPYARDAANLIDRRGGGRKADDGGWERFKELFLHQNRPSVRQCWKIVQREADEAGWRWLGYKACARQVNDRIPILMQKFNREPDTYRKTMAPYIAQDCEAWGAGHLFVADHKALDLFCEFNGKQVRPWITVLMDWRTRKICGWHLSDNPDSHTILMALRNAMNDPANCGAPAAVRLDNGKDFDSFMFQGRTKKQRRCEPGQAPSQPGIFKLLNIDVHFARPYSPTSKGRLERWFRTLDPFCKTFDTYTGISSETKPERLNEVRANPRLVPDFEIVRQRLADHIAGYNASADHSIKDLVEDGKPISPADAFGLWCQTRRALADPESLKLILAHWHKPVTCNRNGFTLTIAGKAIHYGRSSLPELLPFMADSKHDRKPINVTFDPANLKSVRVYDEQFHFICTARMNIEGERPGEVGASHIKQASREKAEITKALRFISRHGITRTYTNEEHAAAVANRLPEERGSRTLKITQTPLDGAAAEVRRVGIKEALAPATAAERYVDPFEQLMKNQNLEDRQPPQDAPAAELSTDDAWDALVKRFGT